MPDPNPACSPRPAGEETRPPQEELVRLARLILPLAPYDGSFDLRLPGVQVSRVSRPYKELAHGVHRAALCLVAQGAKRVLLEKEALVYDASTLLVSSMNLPVAAQVTQASPEAPFLSLRLDLDPRRISELLLKVHPHGLPKSPPDRAIYVAPAERPILRAAARLLELLSDPSEPELLASLAVDEILIRLLRGPMGGRVAQIGREESHLHRINQAVAWVEANFHQPLSVEELAALAHMSASTFHQHFKALTSMSPLQYQKLLRLQEARRLMLSRSLDAGSAGRQVGYLSTSQFSREYSRTFGNPPTKDMARFRGVGSAEAGTAE